MMASNRPTSPSDPMSPPPAAETPPSDPPLDWAPSPQAVTGTLRTIRAFEFFDLLLVVGVILLGFAAASFAVKNPDFWLHLGTGKLLTGGGYSFGTDPFGATTHDRYWTNHSWLFDWGLFKLFDSAGGRTLVLIKAAAFGGLVLLLLSTLRKGSSKWIGVVCMGLMVLACAPRLVLNSMFISILFQGLTVFLLLKLPARPQSYRLPAALAITFALWANLDRWFFLGPLTIALYLLGEILQPTRPGETDRPSRMTLAIALAAGILACMLNPHHYHVWQIPIELSPGSLPEKVVTDPELAPFFKATYKSLEFDPTSLVINNPLTSYALIGLFVLSIAGFVLNHQELRWGWVAVWVGMAYLGAILYRAIPFFAVTAGPLAAVQLTVAAARFKQALLAIGTVQLLNIGRSAGRVVTGLIGIALILASWPGWLHALGNQRRLAWDVQPDPTLEKAARTLQGWRESGRLPDDVHGLILQLDLADYCAYFAPAEKTFIDTRLELHRPEIAAYARFRSYMPGFDRQEYPSRQLHEMMDEQDWAYLVVGSWDQGSARQLELIQLATLWTNFREHRWPGGESFWPLWDIQGRVAILGWAGEKATRAKQLQTMQSDLVRLAFGHEAAMLPDKRDFTPPNPEEDSLLHRWLEPVSSDYPAGAVEAQILLAYLEGQRERDNIKKYQVQRSLNLCAGPLLGFELPISLSIRHSQEETAKSTSAAVLAVRAVRRLRSPTPTDTRHCSSCRMYIRGPSTRPSRTSRRSLFGAACSEHCGDTIPNHSSGKGCISRHPPSFC